MIIILHLSVIIGVGVKYIRNWTKCMLMSTPGGSNGKEHTWKSRRHKRCRFSPWVWKIPGGGHDYTPQYSCLEYPMDRGAWQATVIGSQRVRHDWSNLAPTVFSESKWLQWGNSRYQKFWLKSGFPQPQRMWTGLDWASVKSYKPQGSQVIELGWWKGDNKEAMALEHRTQFPTNLEYK